MTTDNTPRFYDFWGRPLLEGQIVAFPKVVGRGSVSMQVRVIHSIDEKGVKIRAEGDEEGTSARYCAHYKLTIKPTIRSTL